VVETVETNNTTTALIRLSPDLVVSVLSVPTSAVRGTPITVNDTTKNQGQGVAGATTTSFYLSPNNTWDATDTLLQSRPVPILGFGATSPGSTSVTIPAGTVPGNYFILARADATGAVAEAVENNNVLSKAITITP
jgi:trimeric autotransporter adhesin